MTEISDIVCTKPAEDNSWKPIKEFNLEHEKRILVTDGIRAAVVYLSKWSSLWYFDVNNRWCGWKFTYYKHLDLPK